MFLILSPLTITVKSRGSGFNPLNQVYVFNSCDFQWSNVFKKSLGFNPLNQVYVFNQHRRSEVRPCQLLCFNPLNQVYVFNCKENCRWLDAKGRFNPLNQVYVFNFTISDDTELINPAVLIP